MLCYLFWSPLLSPVATDGGLVLFTLKRKKFSSIAFLWKFSKSLFSVSYSSFFVLFAGGCSISLILRCLSTAAWSRVTAPLLFVLMLMECAFDDNDSPIGGSPFFIAKTKYINLSGFSASLYKGHRKTSRIIYRECVMRRGASDKASNQLGKGLQLFRSNDFPCLIQAVLWKILFSPQPLPSRCCIQTSCSSSSCR